MSSVHCPPLQLKSIPSNLQLHVKRYALNISHPIPSRFDEQILCTCRYTLMRTHTCSITYTPKPTPTPTHTRARAHIYTYIHPLVFDTGNFLKQMFTYLFSFLYLGRQLLTTQRFSVEAFMASMAN